MSLNVTCYRHGIPEKWRLCVKQQSLNHSFLSKKTGRRGRNRMVNWYAISAYRHLSCEFESHSWRDVLIMWYSLSMTCGRSVVFSEYSGFLHQWNWPPRHNKYIVESGATHHNPNYNPSKSIIFLNKYKYLLPRTNEHYTVTIKGCNVPEKWRFCAKQ